MGSSNLTGAFERRYATLLGERTQLQEEIARIRRQMNCIPDMERRIAELEPLLKSATTLLRDLNPNWEPGSVRKKRPLKHDSPFPYGACSRRALTVLRTSDEPLTTRQIAMVLLANVGIDKPDSAVVQQTVNTIDSSFRHHMGKTVESCGRNPAQWRAIGKPFEFTE